MVDLKPIRISTDEYDEIEKKIKILFKKEVYDPILKELDQNSKILKNSKDDLYEALRSGKITFSQGCFSGKLNAELSKELRAIGAKWNRVKKCYTISRSDLPQVLRDVISSSESLFLDRIYRIDRKLSSIVPKELASKLKISNLFDRTIFKVESEFQKSVKNLTIAPKITPEARKKIADDWQNNMDLWIQKFTEEEIVKLRKKIQKSVFSGNRYGSAIQSIQDSYGVTASKAKFLARQETGLLVAKLTETRYLDAGIREYKWKSVLGTPQHPVRPRHKALNDASQNKGQIFRFDDPPITSEPGQPERRNNPKQDYNCLPGKTLVGLDQRILKIFRRRFSGKLTSLVFDNAIVHESTGNHPVLTNRGWIASQDVNVGDYLFQRPFENLPGKEVNGKDMEASIEKVFNATSLCSQITRDRISKTDFHGDISEDQYVDIINVDRELMLSRISQLLKVLKEFGFQVANPKGSVFRTIDKTLSAWGLTPQSVVRFCDELSFFIERHSLKSESISVRTGTFGNLKFCEPSSDDSSRDRIFFRDRKFTHPVLIILNSLFNNWDSIMGPEAGSRNFHSTSSESLADQVSVYSDFSGDFAQTDLGRHIKPLRVIDKAFRDFSGHVFNLETITNWYYAKNLIISNCRCVAVPIVRFKK